jgi:hypothetical protein
LLVIFIVPMFSLHFLLKEGKEKCIYDEIPKNQVLVAHYNVIDRVGDSKDDGVIITVTQI